MELYKNVNKTIEIYLPRFRLEVKTFAATKRLYKADDPFTLVNHSPVALSSDAKLTTSSNKHLEKVENFIQFL